MFLCILLMLMSSLHLGYCGETQNCKDDVGSGIQFTPLGQSAGVAHIFLPNDDDTVSNPIEISPPGFHFGQRYHNTCYISTNGFISFDVPVNNHQPLQFPLQQNFFLIAPFSTDIDISVSTRASISYEVHVASSTESDSEFNRVNRFLRKSLNYDYQGTWMLIVEWDNVPPFTTNQSAAYRPKTNTFQAVIVVDEVGVSFAIFIYKCGELEWISVDGNPPPTIGYYAGAPQQFGVYPVESNNADVIACSNCPDSVWTNVLFELSPPPSPPPSPRKCKETDDMAIDEADYNEFGGCLPYIGDFCSETLLDQHVLLLLEPDLVETVFSEVQFFFDEGAGGATEACVDMVRNILCVYYYPPCGSYTHSDSGELHLNFTIPITLCSNVCEDFSRSCGDLLLWVESIIVESEFSVGFINCQNPAFTVYPLPHCCTDFGLSPDTITSTLARITTVTTVGTAMPTVSPPNGSSVTQTVAITGGVLGAAFILIPVVVVGMVCLVKSNRNKKRKSQIQQPQAVTVPPTSPSPQSAGEHRASNPYTATWNGMRTNSRLTLIMECEEYLRDVPESLIIPKESLKLMNAIGQGEFGIVYKAQYINMHMNHKSSIPESRLFEIVAVKTLKGFFGGCNVKDILQESAAMQSFNHPHVLGLIGVCVDAGPAPFIVMPYMANGSLRSYLRDNRSTVLLQGDCDEDEITEVSKRLLDMCIQIAKGMDYLASKKFVHRDLATRNCMIDWQFVIKVADFGLTESMYEREYFRQAEPGVKLPLKWMSPESINDGVFSEKSDVWSFGITCWEIFSGGKTPYPGVDRIALVNLLEDGKRMEKPRNVACSNGMFEVMQKCWHIDPKQRPSFSNLVSFISSLLEPLADYIDFTTFSCNEYKVPVTKPTTCGSLEVATFDDM